MGSLSMGSINSKLKVIREKNVSILNTYKLFSCYVYNSIIKLLTKQLYYVNRLKYKRGCTQVYAKTIPFCMKNLSIHTFGYPGGPWNQSPMKSEGQLYMAGW